MEVPNNFSATPVPLAWKPPSLRQTKDGVGREGGGAGPSTKGVSTMLTPPGQFAPYESDSALLPRALVRVLLVAGRFV